MKHYQKNLKTTGKTDNSIINLPHIDLIRNLKRSVMFFGVILLTLSTSAVNAQSIFNRPIYVNGGGNLGLTVRYQEIKNNTKIILHEGINMWSMLSNGAIVLRENPKYGLTVLNQNISDNAQIILHEGYNLWKVLSNGAIVLKDNPSYGLTVLNQNLSDTAEIILHRGYNTWTNDLPIGEPKSTHTYLGSDKTQIYNYDVDVRIVDFPSNPNRSWLYYFSLQVNFTDHNEWSHGGFQWSGTKEFADNNNKGVNWGGGSDWAGYGGIGVTNTPYTWEKGKWYRYRVWRIEKDEHGLWKWVFSVLDYETGEERQLGTVVTKSEYIKDALVWIETGYGVQCDTQRAYAEWRNPTFRCTTKGNFTPNRGISSYNGTCYGSNNTNQGLISTSPLMWFQTTNSVRTFQPGKRLW
jgi:hypothetical protein